MTYEKIRKVAGICIIISFASLSVYFLFAYCFPIIIPFFLALITAYIPKKLSRGISARTTLPYPVISCLISTVILIVLFVAVFYIGSILTEEATSLMEKLIRELNGDDNFIKDIVGFASSVKERFPKIFGSEAIGDNVYLTLVNALLEKIVAVGNIITDFVADAISGAPSFIFSLIVYVVSLYYLSMDRGGLKSFISSFFSDGNVDRIISYKSRFNEALSGFIRSQLSLLLLTFGELLLGFVILGVDYSLLYAVIVALIDLLPVFGVGTVLVPWSVYCFIINDTARGIGLLILFAVMYTVRQFAEPRLIGKYMNIHPLVALFVTFAGFELFGITGMLFFPLMIYIIRAALPDMRGITPQ